MLRVGLPTRIPYDAPCFVHLGSTLTDVALRESLVGPGADPSSLAAALLWCFDAPKDSYRLGNTRAFFRSGEASDAIFRCVHRRASLGTPCSPQHRLSFHG